MKSYQLFATIFLAIALPSFGQIALADESTDVFEVYGCEFSSSGSISGVAKLNGLGTIMELPYSNQLNVNVKKEMNLLSALSIDIYQSGRKVSPKQLFIFESGLANAFATPEQHDEKYPDGTIFIGLKLAREELERDGSGLSIAGIMGHEFGHIIQFHNDCELEGKERELLSDYIAGWYMAARQVTTPWTDVRSTLNTMYNKGDYDFNSRNHHGTPSERVRATKAGYDEAINIFVSNGIPAYLGAAYKFGLVYVTDNF